ncbi:hypothetical protein F2Q70_00022148 [Brassica cretica]|uniref:Uncharacterized protein n=1 Tax=Brassica cretica TaxID=69181 RepID=A0A8S9GH61_BRACR|nr:hypothetical protein F2Q70_00022148 [Brassica cretica]
MMDHRAFSRRQVKCKESVGFKHRFANIRCSSEHKKPEKEKKTVCGWKIQRRKHQLGLLRHVYNRDDLIQTLGSGILTKNSQNQINGDCYSEIYSCIYEEENYQDVRSKSNLIELKFGRELHDTTGLKFNGGIEIRTVAVKKWEMAGSKEAIGEVNKSTTSLHLTSGIISCHRECFLSEQLLHQKRLFCAYDRLRPSTIGDNGVYLMVGQLILSEYIEEGQYTCVHELKYEEKWKARMMDHRAFSRRQVKCKESVGFKHRFANIRCSSEHKKPEKETKTVCGWKIQRRKHQLGLLRHVYNRDDLIQTLGSGILTKNSQNQINGSIKAEKSVGRKTYACMHSDKILNYLTDDTF